MKKALFGVAIASLAVYGGTQLLGSSDEVKGDKLVIDRIWIDHLPKNERDMTNVFVAISEQPFGVFDANSRWKGQFELFQYEANGNEMRLFYGQTGEKEKIKVKATECNVGGWDFCLEIDGNSRGVKKYYSMEGWEIDAGNVDELRHEIDALIQAQTTK